jgi:hypothetical protein
MNILTFIDALRNSDEYIEHIYLEGGCYQFHLVLKSLIPDCEPFLTVDKNHVVTRYNGKYYDIRGIVSGDFIPLTDLDIDIVKKWSFRDNNLIKITECPSCEEPIIYEPCKD